MQLAARKAHYTARRKEVWEALHPEPSPDYSLESYDAEGDELGGQTFPTQLETDSRGQKKSPQQTKGFAAATAEVTGESKRAINLNLARAEAIGPDILKLSGTSLEAGVELDALAKLSEPERKDLIERAAAGERVTARPTPPTPTPAPTPPAPSPTPLQPPVAAYQARPGDTVSALVIRQTPGKPVVSAYRCCIAGSRAKGVATGDTPCRPWRAV